MHIHATEHLYVNIYLIYKYSYIYIFRGISIRGWRNIEWHLVLVVMVMIDTYCMYIFWFSVFVYDSQAFRVFVCNRYTLCT